MEMTVAMAMSVAVAVAVAMATEMAMNGRCQHYINNMKRKHSQCYIYFYQLSFYFPYLSDIYPWELAWWHGDEPFLECKNIFPQAIESAL